MPNWECYYHIVWATKYREALITSDVEKIVFAAIKHKSIELDCPIYALNGTVDHVHVAVTIIPKLSISEWVRQVKGLSAHEVRLHFPHADTPFRWQKGYSVHSLGKKALPFAIDYVQNQKEHHADETLEPYLEYMEPFT